MSDDAIITVNSGLRDIYGEPAIVRAQRGYRGYGLRPGSIVRRTVRGQKLVEATWLPTGNMARFKGLRDARKFMEAHEDVQHGTLTPVNSGEATS